MVARGSWGGGAAKKKEKRHRYGAETSTKTGIIENDVLEAWLLLRIVMGGPGRHSAAIKALLLNQIMRLYNTILVSLFPVPFPLFTSYSGEISGRVIKIFLNVKANSFSRNLLCKLAVAAIFVFIYHTKGSSSLFPTTPCFHFHSIITSHGVFGSCI